MQMSENRYKSLAYPLIQLIQICKMTTLLFHEVNIQCQEEFCNEIGAQRSSCTGTHNMTATFHGILEKKNVLLVFYCII